MTKGKKAPKKKLVVKGLTDSEVEVKKALGKVKRPGKSLTLTETLNKISELNHDTQKMARELKLTNDNLQSVKKFLSEEKEKHYQTKRALNATASGLHAEIDESTDRAHKYLQALKDIKVLIQFLLEQSWFVRLIAGTKIEVILDKIDKAISKVK